MAEETHTETDTKKKSSSPTRYDHDRLLREAEAIGFRRHVMAGALHGAKAKLSVDEARKACEDFLNREVKL